MNIAKVSSMKMYFKYSEREREREIEREFARERER